jgi:hypothetical protein
MKYELKYPKPSRPTGATVHLTSDEVQWIAQTMGTMFHEHHWTHYDPVTGLAKDFQRLNRQLGGLMPVARAIPGV